MERAAPAGNPLQLLLGSHSGLEACGSHNFPHPRRRVDQERSTCRAGSGYLVEAIPPPVVHRPSANRLRSQLACLYQGPSRSGQGTGPIIAAWVTVITLGIHSSSDAGSLSIALPYSSPASPVVHKYLNNQSLVPNQGLDSADSDSYHCCCFHSFGAEEEVVKEPHRPGSGPGMRSRSRKRRGPIQARFRGAEAGTAGPVRNA